uniref:3'-5' exonuclease domain-containing protein n=1 Tax=Leersia perrieri TaxID=77586 RepID=A0A0D9WYF9_9ORYZ
MDAPPPFAVHLVTGGASSPELALLLRSLAAARVVALDAEWKPRRRGPGGDAPNSPPPATAAAPPPPPAPQFPTVTLLQVACRGDGAGEGGAAAAAEVFVVDLLAVPLADLWESLRELFERPDVLKLGFRFKQDLVYLSATFAAALGRGAGFVRVEPFLDVTNVYYYLKGHDLQKRLPRETKSLATICDELLGVSLSKELQCSDWSCRPLSKGQIQYAASDAYYLLDIFDLFHQKIRIEGKCLPTNELTSDGHFAPRDIEDAICSDSYLASIVVKYSEKISLTESDTKPHSSRRKGKQKFDANAKCKEKFEGSTKWQGPPPWDLSSGGDGCPKFLCDVMIEGLAKHLRCVGIDAATPSSRKPEPRELLNQTYKERRILLTRDVKLLKYQYLASNQVYRVKSLLKHDQLAEVIDTFQLKISEDQLMSRCTKCNGRFIQKPLTLDEAIEASKGFQIIPSCLFNRNLEFWKCTDCNQLYWEGTQYHNAVQKFLSLCNISD